MLPAGKLRYHVINIDVSVNTKDSNGDDIQEWEELYTNVYAQKVPVSVQQFISAQANQAKVLGRFVIRARPYLQGANTRVRENGVVYQIGAWLPDPESGNEYFTAPYGEGVKLEGDF